MNINKSIKKNACLNVLRQFLSVAFPLITFPYVSRILQIENYGKINYSQSIIAYFALIANLGVTNYAIREGARKRRKRKEIQIFSNEVFTINMMSTIIAYMLLFIILISIKELDSYKCLICIYSISFIATTVSIDWLYQIFEDYFYITIRSIVIQLVSIILMFIFVKTSGDYLIYAFITTFSSMILSIISYIYSKKYFRVKLIKLKFKTIKKHLKPIILLFFYVITVQIYVNLDTTMLGILVGDYSVGIYVVSVKIYVIVKQLLNALFNVTLPRLCEYVEQGCLDRYNELLNNITKILLTLILPAICGLFLLSEDIVLLIAGRSYLEAALPLKILSLALIFSVFAGLYCNAIVMPFKLEKKLLQATSIGALVNAVLNLFMIPKYSYTGAAVTTLIAEAIVLIILLWSTKGLYKIEKQYNTIISSFIGVIVIVIVCKIVERMVSNYSIKLIVSVVVSAVLYIIIQILLKNEALNSVLKNAKNKVDIFK